MPHFFRLLLIALWLLSPLCLHHAARAADPAPAAQPVAQPAVPAAPLPGHSLHGEAFNEGPRQAAYLMPGMPNVQFPITTKIPTAQQFFTQGVGQLHGFWYFEAERSFRQAAALDPECAMAYWGLAMANVNNDKRAGEFIKKAVERKATATSREQVWIDALAAWHGPGGDTFDKRRQYIRALEGLVQSDPNDVEAKAFLVYQIWKNSDSKHDGQHKLAIPSHQSVDALLDQIFAAQPDHPAYHYRIHLWDGEQPLRAVGAAARCGQTGPGIAHLWHMPGHTYSKLHRYADAVWQQEASARVDHAHMMRDRVLPDQIHNFAHNNEWLTTNLTFLGRAHDAVALAKNMLELPRHPAYNTLDRGGSSASLGRKRLIDTLVTYEQWAELLALSGTMYFEPLDKPEETVRRHRVLGRAQLGLGNLPAAQQELQAAEALLQARRTARYTAADEAEAAARRDKKSADDIAKAMAEALKNQTPAVEEAQRVVWELTGYVALAGGNQAAAIEQFAKLKDADDLRKDHLALAFLGAGDLVQAEELARRAVDAGPNQAYPLATLVEVLHRANKLDECKQKMEQLRTVAGQADLDLPVFVRLQPIAQALALPADWRINQPASDVGTRPELATLGPFRWEPTAAPDWTLPDVTGKPISLADYRGKPVVAMFYLGFGCLHCAEQLRAFAPMQPEFEAAGISLIGISTETVELLQEATAPKPDTPVIPFPLVSGSDLGVFKAYRAYDDFEQMPLHATVILDGQGRIRWHDISYEPFKDPKFVLQEAKRLLNIP